MVKAVFKYIAEDGKEFDTSEEALAYEETQRNKGEEYYQKYLKTYSAREVLRKHSLSEEGVWEILGEDSNPDLGGPHSQPRLAVIEGKLELVIRKAVLMGGFWQWGGGGSFRKIEVQKI